MEISREDMKDLIKIALEEHLESTVHPKHRDHHDWIEARIKAEEERTQMYKEIRVVVLQWSIPVLGVTIWTFIKGYLKL